MSKDVTEDRFLGGRIAAAQPKDGFRAGHDTVLLAAAVPAKDGERVLELGSGAGIASLCLAVRVPGVNILGIEIDPELVALANANGGRNGMVERVRFIVGDVLTAEIEGAPFDHVFFNPPFHPDTGQVSPSASRDRATRGDAIAAWTQRALDLVAPRGTVTAILRADRVSEMGEGLAVLPLLPREGEPPKRAIVKVRKGEGSASTLPGLVLHEADGNPTPEAEAVLRHAAPLLL